MKQFKVFGPVQVACVVGVSVALLVLIAVTAIAGLNSLCVRRRRRFTRPQYEEVTSGKVAAIEKSEVLPGPHPEVFTLRFQTEKTPQDWYELFRDSALATKLMVTPTGVVSFINDPKMVVKNDENVAWNPNIPDNVILDCDPHHMELSGNGRGHWMRFLYRDQFAPIMRKGERLYMRVHCVSPQQFPESRHIIPSDLLDLERHRTLDRTSLYLSDPGVITNLHFDGHDGYVVQLSGEKRCVLAHPNANLRHHKSPICQRRSLDYKTRISPEEAKAFCSHDHVLRAGEALWCPRGHWHYMENPHPTDVSISLIIRFKEDESLRDSSLFEPLLIKK